MLRCSDAGRKGRRTVEQMIGRLDVWMLNGKAGGRKTVDRLDAQKGRCADAQGRNTATMHNGVNKFAQYYGVN